MRFSFLLILSLPFLSLSEKPQVAETAQKVCDCVHKSNFNKCNNTYAVNGKVLIEELILYCAAYQIEFEHYRNEKYSPKTPEVANNLLEKHPLDLARTNNAATLEKYLKWSFMANKHNYSLDIIQKLKKHSPNNASTYFYEGWIYEIWGDLVSAEIAYESFLNYSSNKALAYQCLANILWLEEELEDEED